MKKIKFASVLLISLILLPSCSQSYKSTSFFAMNTFISMQADCDDKTVLQDIEKKIYSDEKLFSRTIENSDISRLNRKEDFTPDKETASVVEFAFEISERTGGAFCPYLGKISSLWNITGENPNIPDKSELEETIKDINAQKITPENFVNTSKNVQLDLGGIVKGYSAMKAIESLKSNGIENALISFGGSIACIGNSESRKMWTVGIKNPFSKEEIIGTLRVSDAYISVSGAYERFFEKDGVRYHHIFSPETGYPVENDLESTVVVSGDGILSDALSTALFVMGKNKAIEFYKNNIYDFEMLLIMKDGTLYITQGISDMFSQSKAANGIAGECIILN